MKYYAILFFALILAITCLANEEVGWPRQIIISKQSLQPDSVRSSGEYQFAIYYVAKGTRSQGIHGRLIRKNAEILGTKLEETIKTPWGIFVWHGPAQQRKNLWDLSGWLPQDIASI